MKNALHTHRKYFFLLLFSFVSKYTALGQSSLEGKYCYRGINSSSNYIIFNADNTFQFSYAVCTIRDIACGSYSIKNDTVYFYYKSGITDMTCNTQKINLLKFDGQSSYYLFSSLGDTLSRPYKLYFQNDKLYSISKSGQVIFNYKNDYTYKPTKSERRYYKRRYLFFGHFVRKSNDASEFKKVT